ncbi:hypothetical protein NQZ68_027351 [Dissostichus eleginoides]|nr:hypothetical protein NQZ68_027351 [Dissostichus eleginoides]
MAWGVHPALVLEEVPPQRTEGKAFPETALNSPSPSRFPLTLVWTRLIDIFLTGCDPGKLEGNSIEMRGDFAILIFSSVSKPPVLVLLPYASDLSRKRLRKLGSEVLEAGDHINC